MTADLDKALMTIFFAESDRVLLSKVKPAIMDKGFLYAEREIETQFEHIVYQDFVQNVRFRGFQMDEGDLIAI